MRNATPNTIRHRLLHIAGRTTPTGRRSTPSSSGSSSALVLPLVSGASWRMARRESRVTTSRPRRGRHSPSRWRAVTTTGSSPRSPQTIPTSRPSRALSRSWHRSSTTTFCSTCSLERRAVGSRRRRPAQRSTPRAAGTTGWRAPRSTAPAKERCPVALPPFRMTSSTSYGPGSPH